MSENELVRHRRERIRSREPAARACDAWARKVRQRTHSIVDNSNGSSDSRSDGAKVRGISRDFAPIPDRARLVKSWKSGRLFTPDENRLAVVRERELPAFDLLELRQCRNG